MLIASVFDTQQEQPGVITGMNRGRDKIDGRVVSRFQQFGFPANLAENS